MKLKRRFFSSLLVAIFACSFVFVASACGNKEKSGEADATCVKRYQIASFDEYDDVYNILMTWYTYGTCGRFAMNKDEKYVSEGTGSVAWITDCAVTEVWQKTTLDGGNPMVAYYAFYGNETIDLADMTNVKSISLDCYNANDFDVVFGASLMNFDAYTFANSCVTIKPGEWQTLTMRLNPFLAEQYYGSMVYLTLTMNYDYKVAEEDTEIVKAGELYYPQSTVYFDNFYAVIDESPVVVDKVFSSNEEILYFDDISDIKYVEPFTGNGTYDWLERQIRTGLGVSASYNVNPAFTNGRSGSLCVRYDNVNPVRKTQTAGFTRVDYYAGVEILGVVEKKNFLPLKTKGAVIAVDVYNDFDYAKEVFFGVDDKATGQNYVYENEYPFELGNRYPLYNLYRLEPKTWTTIYFDKTETLDLSKGLSRIKFATSKLDITDTGCFYLNNLRLISKEEVQ